MWKIGDWRLDSRDTVCGAVVEVLECEEPCPDNGGGCCCRFDEKGGMWPIDEEEHGGGWHWRKVTSAVRDGIHISPEDLRTMVDGVNVANAARAYVSAVNALNDLGDINTNAWAEAHGELGDLVERVRKFGRAA